MATPLDPLQALILDVDGTVLDTRGNQYNWFTYAAKTFGGINPMPPNDLAFWDRYNKAYETGGMLGLYTMLGIDFEPHSKEIWTAYTEFNNTHIAQPIPGMDAVVKEIYTRSRVSRTRHRALRIAINTTKSWNDVEAPLQACGISPLLDVTVTKDDIYNYCTDGAARRKNIPFDDYKALRKLVPEEIVKELEKPHSIASMLTTQRLGVDPNSIVALEDTAAGIKSYRSVIFPDRRRDIYVIGVTWGFEPREGIAEAQPDEIIDRPQQLVELLGDLGAYR